MILKTLLTPLKVPKKTGNITVKQTEINDFFLWEDNKMVSKINKKANRVLLKDIVAIRAKRGNFNLFYKTDITDEQYKVLDFLKKIHLAKTKLPLTKTVPCGNEFDKKNDILVKLKEVLPENRKTFWKNLTVKHH